MYAIEIPFSPKNQKNTCMRIFVVLVQICKTGISFRVVEDLTILWAMYLQNMKVSVRSGCETILYCGFTNLVDLVHSATLYSRSAMYGHGSSIKYECIKIKVD